jgi:Mg2+/Co2+ transporter CorB
MADDVIDIGLWGTLAAIVVLLLLSALFSGSETALTAASRARMHQLARRGNKRARQVNTLISDRERLIGGILLGNNLVNIFASSLATSILIALFGKAGIAYATALMTALVLIFSEVLPKTYAIYNADRMSLGVVRIIAPVVWLFSPVVFLVQSVVRGTMRVLGVKMDKGAAIGDASEELRGAFDLHRRTGEIFKRDKDMLEGILDLQSVDVADIMIHRRQMTMIDIELPPEEIIEEMLTSGFTRVPAWRDDVENIVGVMHAKDLLLALNNNKGRIEDIDVTGLLRASWFVPDTTTLMEQLNAFRDRREHFALVVDEYGALQGLVTLEDILEEIVGDISDEHDVVRARGIVAQADGSYIVDGATTVRDLNRYCDWQLPETDAATVAGLLINEAKQIPEVGDRFVFHGFSFHVLRRQKNRLNSLRLAPLTTEDDS